MKIDHREIIDQMTRVKTDTMEEMKKKSPARPLSRAETLGLTFKPGEKVRDTVTGEKGVVIDGTIETA